MLQAFRLLALVALLALAACGGGSPGTVHPLGEEASFAHAQVEGNGFSEPTTLAVTVLAVRQGTLEELEAGGFEIEDAKTDPTPWYVDQRYRNDGDVPLNRALRVSMEDAQGDLIDAVTIFNYAGTEYELCPDRSDGDEVLAPGEAFETCTLFFTDANQVPEKVSFLPLQPGTETDWVYWAAK
jgi:hypothetical protein